MMYAEIVKELEDILRFRAKPIGVKFCESVDMLAQVPNLVRPSHPLAMCQVFGLSRFAGKTIGVTAEDILGGAEEIIMGNCASIFGLAEPVDFIRSGEMLGHGCFAGVEEAGKEQDAIKRIPTGKYKAVVVSPVSDGNLEEPDVVAFYASPGQIMQLMNGLVYKDYEPVSMRFVGESSCSDGIVTCFLTGKPAGTIPCFGELQRAGREDEVILAIPPRKLASVLEGVKSWQSLGNSYPVTPFGAQCSPLSMPAVNVYPMAE